MLDDSELQLADFPREISYEDEALSLVKLETFKS